MERRITTPMMEVTWINAVWMWRLRVLSAVVLACISVGLLAVSLARIFDVDLINWPWIAWWLVMHYEGAVLWVLGLVSDAILAIGLETLARWVLAVPMTVFDLLAAYIFVGGLVRLAEIRLYLRSDLSTLQRGPDSSNDAWAQTSWRKRLAASKDVTRKYVTWPARLVSDARLGFYHLTIVPTLQLFAVTVIVLVAMIVYFG